MSAVRQPDVIPIWNVKPEPDEPEFFGEEGLDLAPFPGPNTHSEHDLRCLWSLVWKRWHDRRICGEMIRYNRLFPVNWWREAIEETWITKPKIGSLKFVIAMANNFKREGTPTEKLAKKLAESDRANQVLGEVETTETVKQFWIEKGKATTIEDIADDDPVFLRMSDRLKGGSK